MDFQSTEEIVLLSRSRWMSAAEELQFLNLPISDREHYIYQSDYDNLKNLVRELVVQSLIPFMERCITTWNDQVTF